jgi:hypothetical protein
MKQNTAQNGKGSAQRPTDKKKYDDNWDIIFGKKTPTDCEDLYELPLSTDESRNKQ